MVLTKISGTVTGLKDGMRSTNGFRIGNRPAKMSIAANLMDGDVVTAVGSDLGDFEIYALRNETTKVVYVPNEPKVHVEVLALIFGVITLPFLVGFFILWAVRKNYKVSVAARDHAREVRRLIYS